MGRTSNSAFNQNAKKGADGTHDPKGIISYVDFFIRY